ncbi:hypothetical protein ABK040_011823 [Willaertia magna]
MKRIVPQSQANYFSFHKKLSYYFTKTTINNNNTFYNNKPNKTLYNNKSFHFTQLSLNNKKQPILAISNLILKTNFQQNYLQILMIRRSKNPGNGLLALPGGHLEFGENLLNGAIRELEEETTLTDKYIHFSSNPIYTTNSITFKEEDDNNKEEEKKRRKEGLVIPEYNDLVKGKACDDAKELLWITIALNKENKERILKDNLTTFNNEIKKEENKELTSLEDWLDEKNHEKLCLELNMIYSMPIVIQNALLRLFLQFPFSLNYKFYPNTLLPSIYSLMCLENNIISENILLNHSFLNIDNSLYLQFNDLLLFYNIREEILTFWLEDYKSYWFNNRNEMVDEYIVKHFSQHLINLFKKLNLILERDNEFNKILKKQSPRTLLACCIMLGQFTKIIDNINGINNYNNNNSIVVKIFSDWCINNGMDKHFEKKEERMWFYLPSDLSNTEQK